MVVKVKMINNAEKVLYEGPIVEKCLDYIKRYDDMSIDMSLVASIVYYSYEIQDIVTDVEMKFINKLNGSKYSIFENDGEYNMVCTMK